MILETKILSPNKKILLLAGFFFLTNFLSSQVYFEERLELNTRDQYAFKKVIPIEENGFIIQSLSTISEDNHRVLKFDHYDTSLVLQGTIKHLLQEDLVPFKVFNEKTQFYSLFQSKDGSFIIISIDKKTFKKTYIPGNLREKGKIEDIVINGDQFYFYATTWSAKYLYSINIKTGKTIWKKIAPFSFDLTSFNRIKLFPSSAGDSVYFFATSDKENEPYYLNRISNELNYEKINAYTIKQSPETYLSEIKIIEDNNKSPILFGTYASSSSKKGTKGIFFYNLSKDVYLHKDYVSVESFFDYLPEKLKKKNERKHTGESNFHIRTIFSNYITDYGDIYLVTEFYYPSHYGEYFNYQEKTGLVSIGTNQRKETKQLTHFIVWKFNSDGEIAFQQKINYWPSYRLNNLESNMQLDFNLDYFNILYPDRDKIASYQLDNDGKIIMAENEQPIMMNNEHDIVDYAVGNIKYWYSNRYLSYGYQQITNETNSDGNRDVFYICKLSY